MDGQNPAPPKKPWNGLIPCKYQQTLVSHSFLGGAKWISQPSAVCPCPNPSARAFFAVFTPASLFLACVFVLFCFLVLFIFTGVKVFSYHTKSRDAWNFPSQERLQQVSLARLALAEGVSFRRSSPQHGSLVGRVFSRKHRERFFRAEPLDKLHRAKLHRAKLHRAKLYRAKLHRVKLHRAKLHRAKLHRAKLHRAKLHRAKLHRAKLHRAKLHRAKLHRAKLHRAKWHRAKLHRAKLHRAKLQRAKLHSQVT